MIFTQNIWKFSMDDHSSEGSQEKWKIWWTKDIFESERNFKKCIKRNEKLKKAKMIM